MSILVENWNNFYEKNSKVFATSVLEFSKASFLNLCHGDLPRVVDLIQGGAILIIRSFYSLEQINAIHKICLLLESDGIEGYYPMHDGAPDHIRKISYENDKYAFKSERISYFFYRWNAQNNYEKKLIWDQLDLLWDLVKIIGGYHPGAFKENIPSSGPVDRGQIIIYEAGSGEMESHTDPNHTQRIIAGVEFTERGINYDIGGFYVHSDSNVTIDVQAYSKPGDAVLCLANIPHGVKKIERISSKNINTEHFFNKRVYLGLYTNDSDKVTNRRTSKPFAPGS